MKFIICILLMACTFSSIILISLLEIIHDFSLIFKVILLLWVFASWFFIIIFYTSLENENISLLSERILETLAEYQSESKYVICYFLFMSIFISGVILIIFLKLQYFSEPFIIIFFAWTIAGWLCIIIIFTFINNLEKRIRNIIDESALKLYFIFYQNNS